jgi:hypothetical protein
VLQDRHFLRSDEDRPSLGRKSGKDEACGGVDGGRMARSYLATTRSEDRDRAFVTRRILALVKAGMNVRSGHEIKDEEQRRNE